MLAPYHQESSVIAAKIRPVLHGSSLDRHGQYFDTLEGRRFPPGYLKPNPGAAVPTAVRVDQAFIEPDVTGG